MVVTTDLTRRRPAQCAPLLPSDDVLDTINEDVANPEYNLDEPTMEEELATLNLPNKDNDTTGGDANEQSPSTVMVVPPSADSVHVLLKQALRADVHASLLNCLYNRDDKLMCRLLYISLLTRADAVKNLNFFILLMQSSLLMQERQRPSNRLSNSLPVLLMVNLMRKREPHRLSIEDKETDEEEPEVDEMETNGESEEDMGNVMMLSSIQRSEDMSN